MSDKKPQKLTLDDVIEAMPGATHSKNVLQKYESGDTSAKEEMREPYCNNCERVLAINKELTAENERLSKIEQDESRKMLLRDSVRLSREVAAVTHDRDRYAQMCKRLADALKRIKENPTGVYKNTELMNNWTCWAKSVAVDALTEYSAMKEQSNGKV